MRLKSGTMAVLGSAVCGLALASGASAATLSGTVVHKNAHAQSFVLAARGGALMAVHARRTPALGRQVSVTARRLRNGTWVAQRIRIGHTTKRIRVRGTVTYADAARHTFVVSVRGASLLVHRDVARAHSARAASSSTMHTGDIVTVDGTLAGDTVDASHVHHDGHDLHGVDLEGVVQAINTTASTLTISADDSEQSAATLLVQVPASFQLGLFKLGQSVELIASLNPDGTYTLEQSSDDSSSRHADNGQEEQGNRHGDQQASADQVCMTQEADPNFSASHNGLSFTQFYETDPGKPEDALSRCADAMAQGDASHPSPELQCHLEASDPNFPAAHTGSTFQQFYDPQGTKLEDAYKQCIDIKSPQHDGGGSGGKGSGGSGGTGGPGPSSGGSDLRRRVAMQAR